MSTKTCNTPPVILRAINTPSTALEALFSLNTGSDAVSQPNLPVHVEENFDKFILSQFILYLYINIFIFPETSIVYKNLLDSGLIYIRSQIHSVRDQNLRDLIQDYIDFEDTNKINSMAGMHLLETAIYRIRPEAAYPGLDNIICIVMASYASRLLIKDDVSVYRISIQQIDGFSSPTFTLSPCFKVQINKVDLYGSTPSFWKFFYSINVENCFKKENALTEFFYNIASLALPLDPASLTDQMKRSIIQGNKAGIPFLNYLAMYLREREMGLDYSLSPFADPRRILMRRAHQFFGVGGTAISDYSYLKSYLYSINKYINKDETRDTLSNSDYEIISAIAKGSPDVGIKFTSSVSYEEALEASVDPLAPKPAKKNSKKAITKVVKKNVPDSSEDDAFADDDTTQDTSEKDPDDTDKIADDNIDRTSDVGQDSAVVNKKVFLPLALPTETIDDHLLRLMVLKYVNDTDQDPAPDITPENLESLKYWCSRWLFIASIDQTKKLLTLLNLTGQLKELKI